MAALLPGRPAAAPGAVARPGRRAGGGRTRRRSPSCSRARPRRRWSPSPTCASPPSWRAPVGAAGRSPPAAASAGPTRRRPRSTWSSTSRWPPRRPRSPLRRHAGGHAGDAAGPPALGRVPAALRERGGALAHRAGPLRAGRPHRGAPAGAARPGAGIVSLSDRPGRARRPRPSRGACPGAASSTGPPSSGSAVAVGSGLDLALRPGTAYGAICRCGNAGCGCGSTCCSGFSEFCCAVSGANFCPENTIMGGWWVADNSSYCGGPRYYMDCNATCSCDNGCSGGFPFCEPGVRRDRVRLRPARLRLLPDRLPAVPLRAVQPGRAPAWAASSAGSSPASRPGRSIPPARPRSPSTTPRRSRTSRAGRPPRRRRCAPRPPPTARWSAWSRAPTATATPCSPRSGGCSATGTSPTTATRRRCTLDAPIVGVATCKTGGYFLAAADGGIFDYGGAPFLGSMGGRPLDAPVVGIAASPVRPGLLAGGGRRRHLRLRRRAVLRLHGRPARSTRRWSAWPPHRPAGATGWSAADGGIFTFGDAAFLGSMGGQHLNAPVVAMAATPVGPGLLARRRRRRHLRLRGRRASTARPGPSSSTSRWWAWRPTATTPATGWWPRTAGSSPSAAPRSSGRRHDAKGASMHAPRDRGGRARRRAGRGPLDLVALRRLHAGHGHPAGRAAAGATATAPRRPGSSPAGPRAERPSVSPWPRWRSASTPPRPRRWLVAAVAGVVALLAAASDTRLGGFHLPFHSRQVNERWLDQFRPWVYGAGFGWQIGAGLVTYIKTAALYLMIVLAALTASPATALAIGALFGLVRGLAVLLGRGITSPATLAAFHRRFTAARARRPRRRRAVELLVAVAVRRRRCRPGRVPWSLALPGAGRRAAGGPGGAPRRRPRPPLSRSCPRR